MLPVDKLAFFVLWSIAEIALCNTRTNNSSTTTGQGQLVFAHILFRHGDRTPVDPYPNDPWKDPSYWKEGYGQLTNIGKQQHFALGQYFRKRYQSLLREGAYSPDLVYVQSTDVDRTLMSAESNLAGFFPAEKDQIWKVDLKWQPIPVHTIPEKLDELLAVKKPCPSYNYALKKYKQSPEFKALLKKFQYLLEYLSKHTGRTISSFDDVQYVRDTLFIEQIKNFTLPEWTKKVFVPGGDMDWMSHFSFKIPTITTQLARLKSGFLIRDILHRFTAKTKSELSPDRSLWIYSGHDTTVASILNSFGLFDLQNPPYTATVLFELYKFEDSYYIQLFYKNSTEESLPPLNIPNCGTKCPLEKFYSLYDDIIPKSDYETECRLSLMSMTYEDVEFNGIGYGLAVIIGCSLIVLLLAMVLWKLCYRDRNRNPRWYMRI